ncbi:MAG: glycosyltransferase family 39 protein [Flavobacterium sp.]
MKVVEYIKNNVWLIGIILLATILRLYNIGFQSLWVDEIFTLNISNPDLTFEQFSFNLMLRDGFPYLYYFILHFFYMLFGYSPETARLVSAIGGIAAVYGVYLLGKELFAKNAGLIAAFLLAINEYNIYISQDARPYTLYIMAVVFSFYKFAIFIKNPNLKTAIWYGVFTGLVLNLNFFGFINVFSQVVIVLSFMIMAPKIERIRLFKFSVLSGIIAILLFLPNFKKLLTLFAMDSFWVAPPKGDSLTILFREFLGNSEITLFIFTPIFIYYLITLFRQKDVLNYDFIVTNKFQFSFFILFGWGAIFIIFLLLKSYTDISLMLARYFTSITPIFSLVFGIGLYLIRNKAIRYILIGTLGLFTMINLLVVKQHYTRVVKSQFREISAEIVDKNTNNDIIVSSWGWLFNYYLLESTGRNTIESPLDVYVNNMKSGKLGKNSFWYVDANARNYLLPLELENYLNEHFILQETIEKYDTWAKHYISKDGDSPFLNMNLFEGAQFDGSGSMIFTNNGTYTYPRMNLAKGDYSIVMQGVSLPAKPINNENAHFKFFINGVVVGEGYLGNETDNKGINVNYKSEANQMIIFKIEYDNDVNVNGADRNAIISSVQIAKK